MCSKKDRWYTHPNWLTYYTVTNTWTHLQLDWWFHLCTSTRPVEKMRATWIGEGKLWKKSWVLDSWSESRAIIEESELVESPAVASFSWFWPHPKATLRTKPAVASLLGKFMCFNNIVFYVKILKGRKIVCSHIPWEANVGQMQYEEALWLDPRSNVM